MFYMNEDSVRKWQFQKGCQLQVEGCELGIWERCGARLATKQLATCDYYLFRQLPVPTNLLLPIGTDLQQRALSALWFGEGADGLAELLDELVVFIEHLGGPRFGDEAHQTLFGRCGVGARCQAEAL